jgi:hypothetical protein
MNQQQYFLSALLEHLELGFTYLDDEVYIGNIRNQLANKKATNRFEFLNNNTINDNESNYKYYFSFDFNKEDNPYFEELARKYLLDEIEDDLDTQYHKYFDFDWYVEEELDDFDYYDLDIEDLYDYNILGVKVYLTDNPSYFKEDIFKPLENQLSII